MKLTPAKRQELTSATITQALGLILVGSLVFALAAPASQPAWWSSRGATHAQVVTTNSGIVTTNYVLNDYATVTQGQLKQFTARAVDELNARLTNIDGAGPALTNLVYGWTQDYATNGYNATNLKPSDYSLMTVGQLKYVGGLVYGQLGNAGYTGLTPSWLAVNTNTDNTIALVGQLKQVFNFDLSVAPGTITGLTATASNPGEIDLSWTNPTPNTANSILIQESTDGGVTWTTVDTLSDPTINSYAVTGLSQGSSYTFQATTSSTSGGSGATSSSSSSVQAPATPRYAVIDLGTNFFPVAINNSGIVAGNLTNNGGGGAEVWSQGSVAILQSSPLGPGRAKALNDSGTIVGGANFNYTLPGSSPPIVRNEGHACSWANTNSAPLDLDSVSTSPGAHNLSPQSYESSASGISSSGNIYGTFDWNLEGEAAQFSSGSAPMILDAAWEGGTAITSAGAPEPGAEINAVSGTNYCGDYAGAAPGLPYAAGFLIDSQVIPFTTNYSAVYRQCAATGINTNCMAVGYEYTNSIYQGVILKNGAITNLPGSGTPRAINDYTFTNITSATPPVTNVTYAPQIVGVDGTGTNGLLWDQTMYDGTPTTNGLYVAKSLNKLIPGASGTNPPPWNVTSAVALNNAGAIVASATYTSLNTDGSHGTPSQRGALLVPAKVTWETIGTNTSIDDNNDPVTGQPMTGGGKRIYPDKQNPNDTGTGRNKVTLRVNAGATAVGWKVYVKAFDVDDPTPDSIDVDTHGNRHILDTNDTDTVKKGNDNLSDPESTPQTGFFTDSDSASDNATLDSTGQATFEFNVGYQPGNNYRVAVTFLKVDDLNNLQVTDSTKPYYVWPSDQSPSGFSGAMSPMLTVWRRLWIEQDSMTAVPTSGDQKNFITGNVTAVVRNSPVIGQSTISTDTLFDDDANRFEDGIMTINGVDYPVVSNTDTLLPSDVVITGTPADADVIDKSFKIVDDDDMWLPAGWAPPLPNLHLVTSEVVSLYSPAYILVVDASTYDPTHDYNPNKTVPFQLNASPIVEIASGNLRQSEDLTTSNQCWTHLVVAAYQPDQDEDKDPDDEVPMNGVTLKIPFIQAYSLIFLETIRDPWKATLPSGSSVASLGFEDDVAGITSHEIAHSPGSQSDDADHAEGGLMGANAQLHSHFLAPTLLRMRESKTWNGD